MKYFSLPASILRPAFIAVTAHLLIFCIGAANAQAPSAPDTAPHKIQFITVASNVKLEVLDWGGTGRPLILLAGAGDTAHVFDKFAPKLAKSYHVYGITRRGFGASSSPDPAISDYTADRLGDDVLAVMNELKLNPPVLVGHSLGGEELSSIGSRYPKKVSGLVYLDAAYAYSYYAPGNLIPAGANLIMDANDLRRKVDGLTAPGITPQQSITAISELLRTNLPQLQTDLLATQKELRQSGAPLGPPIPQLPCMLNGCGLLAGLQKYTVLNVPVLAMFAVPPIPPGAPMGARANLRRNNANQEAEIKRFEAGNPSARVVLVPNADHEIFVSNESVVLQEMKVFIDSLPKQ